MRCCNSGAIYSSWLHAYNAYLEVAVRDQPRNEGLHYYEAFQNSRLRSHGGYFARMVHDALPGNLSAASLHREHRLAREGRVAWSARAARSSYAVLDKRLTYCAVWYARLGWYRSILTSNSIWAIGWCPVPCTKLGKSFFEARNSLRVMIQIRSLLPILIFFIPLAPAIPFGPTFAITASQIYFNTGHIIAWGAKECYFVSHVTRCYSFLFYYLHVCIYCRELYTARRQVTKREIDQMYSSPLRSMSEHHALFSYVQTGSCTLQLIFVAPEQFPAFISTIF